MIAKALMGIITCQIVGFVVGLLRLNNKKYTNSTTKFDISLGGMTSMILLGCSIVFLLPAIPLSMSVLGENNRDWWICFVGLGLPFLIISLLSMQKVSVNGNTITIKSVIPPKHKVHQFSEITHYSSKGDITTVYSGDKKLFSFDADHRGAKNMLNRFKKDGIKRIEDHAVHTICKADLKSAKNAAIVPILFFICWYAFFIFSLYALLAMTFRDFLLANLVGVCLGLAVSIPLYLFHTGKTLALIERTEKALNIDFDKEMAALGVESFNYRDENWYGVSFNMEQAMINRRYVKEIVKTFYDREYMTEEVTIRGIDGKKFKFKEDGEGNFREWFEKHS